MAVFAIHYDYPDDPAEMLAVRPERPPCLVSVFRS